MRLEIWSGGVFLGTTVRGGAGNVYAYDAEGSAVGCFQDSDAAAAALAGRLKAAA